jgi:hypothetical protein
VNYNMGIQQIDKTSIRIEGKLTQQFVQKTEPLYFDVPEGVTEIHIAIRYHPRLDPGQPFPHQVSMMIFDPSGPRCEISRPTDEGIIINAATASPGAVPGPIQPGRWALYVLLHRLMGPAQPDYVIEVDMTSAPVTAAPRPFTPGTVAPRGPGWYRGDLHAHTIHSDGSWDVPVLSQWMRDQKLDFMTLSDHNTISGLKEIRSLADDGLLTIGGMELSPYFGHALALGITDWFDWRIPGGGEIGIPELAQKVLSSGAFFVTAHPMSVGEPECCGCRWLYTDMMPGNSPATEVWNACWADYNEDSLQLYYGWLNQGHKLVATAGTDIHGRPSDDEPGRYGYNVVYAGELSEQGILDALKLGHSYISGGPSLIATARTASGAEGMVGDVLPAEDATVTVAVGQAHPGDVLRLIVDGAVRASQPVAESAELSWSLPAGSARWCTVELRDSAHGMWAITNPIFFGAPVVR